MDSRPAVIFLSVTFLGAFVFLWSGQPIAATVWLGVATILLLGYRVVGLWGDVAVSFRQAVDYVEQIVKSTRMLIVNMEIIRDKLGATDSPPEVERYRAFQGFALHLIDTDVWDVSLWQNDTEIRLGFVRGKSAVRDLAKCSDRTPITEGQSIYWEDHGEGAMIGRVPSWPVEMALIADRVEVITRVVEDRDLPSAAVLVE